MSTITVRIDDELEAQLGRLAASTGRSKSELVREAIRRQVAITQFNELRRRAAPFAELQGWLTDEDVFRNVS